MKNKILFISIVLMISNYYIERFIFYYKNFYYSKNNQNIQILKSNKITIKGAIEVEILENNFGTLLINKGTNHGIKVNQVVIGPNNGFVGIVEKVESNIAIIKTFWMKKNNFIVVNGKNAYGYLKSNGYHLTMESKQKYNFFNNNDDLYISITENKLIEFGKLIQYKNHLEPIPIENIIEIKTLYILV